VTGGGELNIPYLTPDQVGPWSELKLEVLQGYVAAYSTIMRRQKFRCVYVDAFCGGGLHISDDEKRPILGSPLRVLSLDHPFRELYFIDRDAEKIRFLKSLTRHLTPQPPGVDVHFRADDATQVLSEEILPNIRWDAFDRCLCFLDPYSFNYPWALVEECGRNRAVEVILHFPMMALNRAVLRRDPSSVSEPLRARMRTFWGDDSWRQIVYSPKPLFPESSEKDAQNIDVVNAYRERLRNVAGFNHVSNPLPFRNRRGNVLYYLVLASHNETAVRIMNGMIRARERARWGEAWRGQRSSGRT